jgi:hypothetical protein
MIWRRDGNGEYEWAFRHEKLASKMDSHGN